MSSLPSNVHVSTHPCLLAKLSQLRSANTTPKETKALVHEISLFLAAEALGSFLTIENTGVTDVTPLGAPFEVQKVSPKSIVLVPVLRSGLGMLEGLCFSNFPRFFYLSVLFVSVDPAGAAHKHCILIPEEQLSRLSSPCRFLSTTLGCSVR